MNEPRDTVQDPLVADDIKTMKLYTHIDRFEDEMKARGLVDKKITEKDLSSFDMMHYYGAESVKEAAISLDLEKRPRILGLVMMKIQSKRSSWAAYTSLQDHLLSINWNHMKDIGSGLGGPARVLSELNPNVRVVACEYQSDLNEKAKYLTERCSLRRVFKMLLFTQSLIG